MGLAAALGQYDVAPPPIMILRDTMRGVVGPTIMPQQQSQSKMHFKAYECI